MLFSDTETIGIISHKVGDKVSEYYHSSGVMNFERKPSKGTVIYVHPYGRFYTVQFDFKGAKVRESYTVRSDINPMMLTF